MKKPERQTYFLTLIRERGGQDQPGRNRIFRFLFAYESISHQPAVVKTVRLESSTETPGPKCNCNIYNRLRRFLCDESRLWPLPDHENRETFGHPVWGDELLL